MTLGGGERWSGERNIGRRFGEIRPRPRRPRGDSKLNSNPRRRSGLRDGKRGRNPRRKTGAFPETMWVRHSPTLTIFPPRGRSQSPSPIRARVPAPSYRTTRARGTRRRTTSTVTSTVTSGAARRGIRSKRIESCGEAGGGGEAPMTRSRK